ncbi:unnamed protein product [Ixodes pacificus]
MASNRGQTKWPLWRRCRSLCTTSSGSLAASPKMPAATTGLAGASFTRQTFTVPPRSRAAVPHSRCKPGTCTCKASGATCAGMCLGTGRGHSWPKSWQRPCSRRASATLGSGPRSSGCPSWWRTSVHCSCAPTTPSLRSAPRREKCSDTTATVPSTSKIGLTRRSTSRPSTATARCCWRRCAWRRPRWRPCTGTSSAATPSPPPTRTWWPSPRGWRGHVRGSSSGPRGPGRCPASPSGCRLPCAWRRPGRTPNSSSGPSLQRTAPCPRC